MNLFNIQYSIQFMRWCGAIAAGGALLIGGVAAATEECVPAVDTSFGVPGADDDVLAFTEHDDGLLYVGGQFGSIGGTTAAGIARWDGQNFSALPGGGISNQQIYDLASFDGDVYAAGYFDQIGGVSGTAKLARWDGAQWNSIDAQLEMWWNQLWKLTVHDDGSGPALYIGGNFEDLGAQAGLNHIARWDGESFSAVGGTIGGNVPLIVFEIASWDDGDGDALYIGGRFTSVDGVEASRIAKWDGEQWHRLGDGLTGPGAAPSVMAMAAYDDGTGEQLYVAGQAFDQAGGVTAHRVARWDGEQWSAVGDGFDDGIVWDLRVFDAGEGESLYAFGTFPSSGGKPLNGIARWDGEQWQPVGSGADGSVYATFAHDDGGGDGEQVYIGGAFSSMDGLNSNRIARWSECEICPADLTGDGAVGGADLGVLLSEWGDCPDPDDCPADLTGNGSVAGADLGVLLSEWGDC